MVPVWDYGDGPPRSCGGLPDPHPELERMAANTLNLFAALLALIGFVLIVAGLGSSDLVWRIGLGLVGSSMVLAFLTRWAAKDDTQAEEGS